jgi:hypothetical protein
MRHEFRQRVRRKKEIRKLSLKQSMQAPDPAVSLVVANQNQRMISRPSPKAHHLVEQDFKRIGSRHGRLAHMADGCDHGHGNIGNATDKKQRNVEVTGWTQPAMQTMGLAKRIAKVDYLLRRVVIRKNGEEQAVFGVTRARRFE